MLCFPENYGGTKDGFQVIVDLLREVAEVFQVLQKSQSFLDVLLSTRLRTLISHPQELKPTKTMNVFKRKIKLLVDNICYCLLSDWRLDFSGWISFLNPLSFLEQI